MEGAAYFAGLDVDLAVGAAVWSRILMVAGAEVAGVIVAGVIVAGQVVAKIRVLHAFWWKAGPWDPGEPGVACPQSPQGPNMPF